MSNNLLPVLGIAAIGAGVAFVASKAYGSSDDAGTTPPDATSGPEFDVQASSGLIYKVRFVKAFETESGTQSFWDVFTPDVNQPLRIVRYSQLENDTNSRVFISTPLAMTNPALDAAMRDFGIRFEGGAVSDPIPASVLVNNPESVKLLPGQILVAPGAWMATADVGFPQSLIVSAGLIKAALEEQGWRQVAVFTSAPASWPLSKNGNYFIEAVWNKEARIMSVPPQVIDIRSNALV